MNYEFQPGRRRGRNKFVGSWQERGWQEITLPFAPNHLIILLQNGVDSAEFTHQDIAHWCDEFAMADRCGQLPRESVLFADIAEDVSAQWDLFLVNTYSLEQLQILNFSLVRLPTEWFSNWLQSANVLLLRQ
ncbi:MAG: hypothetical protein ACRYFR_11200 [Janthinobacterium lividum]